MIRTRSHRSTIVIAVATAVVWGSGPLASTLRPNFIESQIVAGLASPTAMAFAPDGRIFVCEQGGRLRVVKNGVLLSTPFIDSHRRRLGRARAAGRRVRSRLRQPTNSSTSTTPRRLQRFTIASAASPRTATSRCPAARSILLELNNLSSATNHNGGAMHFGPDGKLYIAVGDNANGANSQSLANLLGKILRINRDGSIPSRQSVLRPDDGVNRRDLGAGAPEPVHVRLPARHGRMFINDVGQNTWEEINDGQAGANYGWPDDRGTDDDPAFTRPLYAYQHARAASPVAPSPAARSTRRATQFPAEYVGDYFFADYCGGWIDQLDADASNRHANVRQRRRAAPVDVHVGPDGALYYLARGTGATTGVVQRIAASGPQAPTITTQPQNRTVSAGQPATFSVVASGSQPLTYQWQRRRRRHRRRHSVQLHAASRHRRGQRQPVPMRVTNIRRIRDQRRGDADGHRQRRASAGDSDARRGDALHRGNRVELLGSSDGSRGRHPAGIAIHVADRLSSRYSYASRDAADIRDAAAGPTPFRTRAKRRSMSGSASI